MKKSNRVLTTSFLTIAVILTAIMLFKMWFVVFEPFTQTSAADQNINYEYVVSLAGIALGTTILQIAILKVAFEKKGKFLLLLLLLIPIYFLAGFLVNVVGYSPYPRYMLPK